MNMEWLKGNAGLFTLGIFVMANITYMENRIGNMENRMENRENRMENRMEKMENRMEKMENRLNAKIETEISKLETEIQELRSLIITLIAKNESYKKTKNKRKPAQHKPTLASP